MTTASKRRGPGRPVEHRLGEDLAVIFALIRSGSTTSIDDLSHLLPITPQRARQIVDDLADGSSLAETEAPRLAYYEDEEGRIISYVPNSNARASRVRLTASQAQACCEALDRLGIPRDETSRARIEAALYPLDFVAAPVSAQAAVDDETLEILRKCAESIVGAEPGDNPHEVRQHEVIFDYAGENDEKLVRRRHVIPLAIHIEEGAWCIDGHDLDAHGMRHFEVARITNFNSHTKTAEKKTATISSREWDENAYVGIVCNDEDAFNRLLSIEGAVCHDRKARVLRIPYGRADWLPRQLLALRDKIEFVDENSKIVREIKREMHDAAKRDLAEAKRIRGRRDATDKD